MLFSWLSFMCSESWNCWTVWTRPSARACSTPKHRRLPAVQNVPFQPQEDLRAQEEGQREQLRHHDWRWYHHHHHHPQRTRGRRQGRGRSLRWRWWRTPFFCWLQWTLSSPLSSKLEKCKKIWIWKLFCPYFNVTRINISNNALYTIVTEAMQK